MADTLSDIELLLCWKQGDAKAFETLYKRYAVKLLTIAMQKTGDRELSEELVQDVFLIMFNKKVYLNEISSVFAFLYTILKNLILDKYRHDLILIKHENHLSMVFAEADHSTERQIETRELEKMLKYEIAKLPFQCQNVFKLSRNEFLSNKEIALRLNISENTVEQHMRKALKILRGTVVKYLRCFLF